MAQDGQSKKSVGAHTLVTLNCEQPANFAHCQFFQPSALPLSDPERSEDSRTSREVPKGQQNRPAACHRPLVPVTKSSGLVLLSVNHQQVLEDGCLGLNAGALPTRVCPTPLS